MLYRYTSFFSCMIYMIKECVELDAVQDILEIDLETEEKIHQLSKYIPELTQLSFQLKKLPGNGEIKQKMLKAYEPIVLKIQKEWVDKTNKICLKKSK